MLLMSLDPTTAAELLKDVDTELVQELAVELACKADLNSSLKVS